ncbi:hypothetical protein EBI01_18095 [Marinomonas rhizomae]|uniref:Uncharacterized protein n=1 Tax=Marinomonas rhizomae TaxID=491948 RepID=A0A366IWT3_9GAMM|nr:hypothetical protein [Marinomonas rhizomae]RBP78529.1 hypothetical protein DFP80_11925 [Marinomonas rhizomae]RNF70100.1 hypothetical protein EBI01_18095 [Marinomonas rhizomae]
MKSKIKENYRDTYTVALATGAYLAVICLTFDKQIRSLSEENAAAIGSFLGGIFAPLAFFILLAQFATSQANTRNDIKKDREREDEKKRIAQPIFKINKIKYRYKEIPSDSFIPRSEELKWKKSNKIEFEFKNIGKNARNINIELISKPDLNYLIELEETLDYSEKKEIIKEIPEILINTQYIEVKIHYLDINNEINFQAFSASLCINTSTKTLDSKVITTSNSFEK